MSRRYWYLAALAAAGVLATIVSSVHRPPLEAQASSCNMSRYKAIDGMSATADADGVTLSWVGERGGRSAHAARCRRRKADRSRAGDPPQGRSMGDARTRPQPRIRRDDRPAPDRLRPAQSVSRDRGPAHQGAHRTREMECVLGRPAGGARTGSSVEHARRGTTEHAP